jgi:hypothetical protein
VEELFPFLVTSAATLTWRSLQAGPRLPLTWEELLCLWVTRSHVDPSIEVSTVRLPKTAIALQVIYGASFFFRSGPVLRH